MRRKWWTPRDVVGPRATTKLSRWNLPWCSVKILLADAMMRESFGALGLLRLARIDEAAPMVERFGLGSLVDCWLPIAPPKIPLSSLSHTRVIWVGTEPKFLLFLSLFFHFLIILIYLAFMSSIHFSLIICSPHLERDFFLSSFFHSLNFYFFPLLIFGDRFLVEISQFHDNETICYDWNSLIIRSQISMDALRLFLTRFSIYFPSATPHKLIDFPESFEQTEERKKLCVKFLCTLHCHWMSFCKMYSNQTAQNWRSLALTRCTVR